jgi:hypothetical protein
MLRLVMVGVAFALLLVVTVLVFEAFDGLSHSASDTLRPFAISMVPVWAIVIAGARAWLRAPARFEHDRKKSSHAL